MRWARVALALASSASLAWSAQLDSRITGVWTRTAGKDVYFLRLESDGYQTWGAGPKGGKSAEAGALIAPGGDLRVVLPDGRELTVKCAPEGADGLAVTRSGGDKESWHRAPVTTVSPGEENAGAGFSEDDRKDPDKCWEEATRLFGDHELRAALPWFRKAAELGHTKATFQLAGIYERGLGTERNAVETAHWYRVSAEAGNTTAMVKYAALCEVGAGVEENWIEAGRWYHEAARAGDSQGEAALARAFRFGIGVPQDRAQAIDWYRRAAAHGNAACEREAAALADAKHPAGFRSDREREAAGGSAETADPKGKTFKSASERLDWLKSKH